MHLDMLTGEINSSQLVSILVPRLRVKDLIVDASRVLLFLDLQGEDFSVMESLEVETLEKISLLYFEVENIENSKLRRKHYSAVMKK